MKRRPIGRREAVEQKKVLSVLSPEYMKSIDTVSPSSWRQQLKPGPVGPEVQPRSAEAMKRHEVAMRRYAGWTEDQMVGSVEGISEDDYWGSTGRSTEDVPGWGRAKDHYRLTREDVRANPRESFPPTIEKYWEETPIFHGQRRPGGNIANAGGFDTGGARTANAVFISHSEYTSTRFLRSQDESFNLHTKWMYEGRVSPKKVFNHHDPTHVAELSDRLHAVLRGEVYTREEAEDIKKLGRSGGDAERTAADFLQKGERASTEPALAGKAVDRLQQQIQEGHWYALENRVSQDAIRDLGYDFFTVDGLGHHRGGTVGAVLDKSALKFHRKKALHAVKEEGVHQEFSTKEHTDWMPINKKAHSKYLEEQTLRYETDRISGLSSQERRIGLRDLERRKKKMSIVKAQRHAKEKKIKVKKTFKKSREQKLEDKRRKEIRRAESLKQQRKEKFKQFKTKKLGRESFRRKKLSPMRGDTVTLSVSEIEQRLKKSRVDRKFNEGGMLSNPPDPNKPVAFYVRDSNLRGKHVDLHRMSRDNPLHLDRLVEELKKGPGVIPSGASPEVTAVLKKIEHIRKLLGGEALNHRDLPAEFIQNWRNRDLVGQIINGEDPAISFIKVSESKLPSQHMDDIRAKVEEALKWLEDPRKQGQGSMASMAAHRAEMDAMQDFEHMLLHGALTRVPDGWVQSPRIQQLREAFKVIMITPRDRVWEIADNKSFQALFARGGYNNMYPTKDVLAESAELFLADEDGALRIAHAVQPVLAKKTNTYDGRAVNAFSAPDYVEELLESEFNAKKSFFGRARDTVQNFKKRVKAGKVKRTVPKGAIESAGKKGFLSKFLKIFGIGGAAALLVGLPVTAKAAEIGGAAGGSNLMPVIAAVAGTGIAIAGWKAWSSRVAKSEKKVGEFAEEALGDKAPRFRIPTGRDLIGGRASLIENELELTTRGLAGSMSSVINDWGYVRRQSTTGGVIDTKWGRVWNTNGTGKYAAPGIARNGGIEGWATVRSEKELYQAWDHYIMNSEGLGSGTRRTAYRALGGKGSSVNKFLARWGGVGTMFPGAMAFYFAAKDAIHGYQKEGLIGGIKGAITGYLSAAIFNKVAGTILLNGVAGVMGAGALVGIGYAAFKIFDVRNEGNQYLQSMRSQKTSWAKGVSSFSGSVPATMRGRSLKAMEQSQFSTLKHLGSEASMLSAPRSRYATTTRVWGSRQMLSF